MYKNTRIYRGIVLVVLLLCTVYLIYSIVTEPVGKYGLDYIVLALAVTAGFIALSREKRQKCSEDNYKWRYTIPLLIQYICIIKEGLWWTMLWIYLVFQRIIPVFLFLWIFYIHLMLLHQLIVFLLLQEVVLKYLLHLLHLLLHLLLL